MVAELARASTAEKRSLRFSPDTRPVRSENDLESRSFFSATTWPRSIAYAQPFVMNEPVRSDPTPPIPDLAAAETMLAAALGQIVWARQYTLELLAATPRELWFERPMMSSALSSGTSAGDDAVGLPTSVAWQVGHLAVSQYGLLMFRIFGRQADDLSLIPGKFRKTFARGSDPAAKSVTDWSADELADRLERVHQAAIAGLTQGFDSGVLLEPVDMPYAVYPIKLGAILFCPLHEQIHSGQIGLIRRGLGMSPVR